MRPNLPAQAERLMHHSLAGLVSLLIACTACATPPAVSPPAVSPPAVSPTAPLPEGPVWLVPLGVRVAAQTPVGLWVYESPSGRFRGSAICYQGYMKWDCFTTFPNGSRLQGVPANWSPDERYVVVAYGATHDSAPIGDQVWDMLNGVQLYQFSYNAFAWSPTDPHTLVHFAGYEKVKVYNPETGEKRELATCPEWFQAKYLKGCEDWGGVIIGGRLDGLPDGIAGTMNNSTGSLYMLSGNGSWSWTLKASMGPTYFCPKFPRYDAYPQCYLVQVVGDQAYVIENGQVTATQADHLDFRFEKWQP